MVIYITVELKQKEFSKKKKKKNRKTLVPINTIWYILGTCPKTGTTLGMIAGKETQIIKIGCQFKTI